MITPKETLALLKIGLEKEEPETLKIVITTEDFDKAIAVKWSTQTCILSQCAIRYGLRINGEPYGSLLMAHSAEARDIQKCFDQEWGVNERLDCLEMRKLREMLPVTVIIPDDGI